jgi:hypothetical protein
MNTSEKECTETPEIVKILDCSTFIHERMYFQLYFLKLILTLPQINRATDEFHIKVT